MLKLSTHRLMHPFYLMMLASLLTLLPLELKASTIKQYDEVVSLGTACQAAWQLEGNGIRRLAYPFDWLVTPFHGLIPFLTHQGAGFLDRDKIEIVKTLPGKATYLHVADLTYDIHFIHDFRGGEGIDNYDKIKDKYDRRIQRFFTLLQSNKKILFFRVQISRDEAIVLDSFIHTHYPKLEYTLVAINDSPDAENDWGLERVRNFYMHQTIDNWEGDGEKWKEIFSHFSIKESKKKRPEGEKW